MTTEQTENLAKHIFAGYVDDTSDRERTDAQMAALWASAGQDRYRSLARVTYALCPDIDAQYLDAAPF